MNHAYRSFIAAVMTSFLLLVGGVSTAGAFHIPSATYIGTHSGGGAVIFDVSADGSAVTRFRVENYKTEFCDVAVFELPGAPIVNNSFSFSSAALKFSYSGTFPGVQLAQGTFNDTECATGTLTWTARTTASPAGSAECISAQGPATEAEAALVAAQAKVKRANEKLRRGVRQVKNAQRAVKRAATKDAEAKRKALASLRVAIRARTRANRELRQAKNGRTQAAKTLAQAQAAKTAVCGPGV
ncbi:MAG TPA: hypothetical protein VNO20_07125 [Solirubrobacterales bacterium]|nr:hypothetical protein [Solirubrobacterales bacterium]